MMIRMGQPFANDQPDWLSRTTFLHSDLEDVFEVAAAGGEDNPVGLDGLAVAG